MSENANPSFEDNYCAAVVHPDCENEPYCGKALPCPDHPQPEKITNTESEPTTWKPIGGSRWRKKPVVVSAIQWTGQNSGAVSNFLGTGLGIRDGYVNIETREGTMKADKGDWIICGVKGEFYPCKPDIFAATYEPASSPAPEQKEKGSGLKACPFCGAVLIVRERFASHPPSECFLASAGQNGAPIQLVDLDYAAWNRRAEPQTEQTTEREIEVAVGGAYKMLDGREFWIDGPVAREIARRAVEAGRRSR